MRFVARFCFVAVCTAFVCHSLAAARAGHRRVLGVIAQADRGHLDTANAVQGADIYSCDKFNTDEGGVLRVKVGASQLYLSASSAAALEDDGTTIQALATGGTVGFSFSPTADLSVRTPAGIIRSSGPVSASGQVVFTSPRELIISAIHGDLVLDNGGELRTIPEGKSADVTFDNELDNGCHDEAAADQQGQQRPYVRHRIGFYIFTTGAIAGTLIPVWYELTESNSKVSK